MLHHEYDEEFFTDSHIYYYEVLLQLDNSQQLLIYYSCGKNYIDPTIPMCTRLAFKTFSTMRLSEGRLNKKQTSPSVNLS